MTYEQFSLAFAAFALGFAVSNLVWGVAMSRRSNKSDPREYDAEKHSGMY